MSQGRNAIHEIEVKTECDGEKCPVCYYDNTNGIHNGNITSQLISCDFISFGDYDNSCAVERANIRYLKENNLIEKLETGSYGYEKAWLLDTPENRELLNSLFDYPCFDDELVSEIENEIETEYIKDCASDLHKLLSEDMQQALQEIYIFDDIDVECYRKACETSNTYFEVESGGNGYIDFKRIVKDYAIALCDKFPAIKSLCTIYETVNNVPKFSIDFYENMSDMQSHRLSQNNHYNQDEILQIVAYCIELESLIEKLQP